jgi:hypothetical protein
MSLLGKASNALTLDCFWDCFGERWDETLGDPAFRAALGASLDGRAVPASVDRVTLAILQALWKRAPDRLSYCQLVRETQPRVSRRTLARRLPALIAAGLVVRPEGKKSGHALTERGRALCARRDESGPIGICQMAP